MAAANRYTGANYVITWQVGATVYTISNDYSKLDFKKNVKLEDKTAANDTDASYNATYKEGEADLTFFDTSETIISSGIDAALIEGTVGVLSIYAKGIVTGKAVLQGPFIVENHEDNIAFDKNVETKVKFRKNGPMTKDDGALQ